MEVQSYLCDGWCYGAGETTIWHDPTTGEPVASTDLGGLDLAAAMRYAREVGGPALAETTFHDRAAMLRAAAGVLGDKETKQALYETSYRTGATKADSWIDIDGGIGTLFSYSSRGKNELPNSKTLLDGDLEALSRDGDFVGRHIYTPRQGVALQINAFNFPIWGALEKMAPALLAGMPVIVKAAEQTAFLTEQMIRALIEAQVFPAGAIQLVCGPAHDLLEHVQSQDVVSFTGSAATAARIRAHGTVLAANPRLVTETDSLNCTVLGDCAADAEEIDWLVEEVAKEVCTKAGQKCTAIRRVLVPAGLIDQVGERLVGRLRAVKLGDPRDESVQVGPLATTAQKQEVLRAIELLSARCEILLDGRETAGALEGAAFVGPTLLKAGAEAADVVNRVEPFGPVCTLLPYSDLDNLVALIRAGEGALVGSVFSADPEFAQSLVSRIASYHGRLLLVDKNNATSHTGHGSPLPTLLHGGPGRAGGGEELGGIRSVKHYMQRTAIQSSPAMLAKVTGQWNKGAEIVEPEVHPFRIPFNDLDIGTTFVSTERTVTLDDIEAFAALTGDTFYAHMDEEAAQRNPLFGGRVAHGYFLISAAAGLFVDPPYGPVLANYGIDHLRFTKPVKPGTRIKVRLTCKSKSFRDGRGYGEVAWDTEITDETDNVCAVYDVLTMVSEHAVPDSP